MLTILPRELKSYFQTATGYIFMIVYLMLFGIYFTYININPTPNNAYTVTIENMVFIFVLLSPLLTMKALSEERKNKTDQLLLTSPKSVSAIVLGKFFAAIILFFITLLITTLYPIILSFFGDIYLPTIVIAYIGFFFMGCTFIGLGIFISSLTENQLIAGVSTLGISMILWLVEAISSRFPVDSFSGFIFLIILASALNGIVYYFSKNIWLTMSLTIICVGILCAIFYAKKSFFEGMIKRFSDWFSIPLHSKDFYLGILDFSDLIYFISLICLFLYFTIFAIERRRWT
nr:ABC transporter permease [Paenibacillus bovis]